MSVTSGRRLCPSKHSVHNSQSVALIYNHKYCIPDCAVTVVTAVNSRMKLETCMLTESCQFLVGIAFTSYFVVGYVESTSCINSILKLAEKSIIISRIIIKESKRMHTVHNNDVFGIPV